MVMSLLATNEVGLGLFTLTCLWYTQGGDSQLATGVQVRVPVLKTAEHGVTGKERIAGVMGMDA